MAEATVGDRPLPPDSVRVSVTPTVAAAPSFDAVTAGTTP